MEPFLLDAVTQFQAKAEPILNHLHQTVEHAVTSLHASDSPVAQQLVSLLANDRVVQVQSYVAANYPTVLLGLVFTLISIRSARNQSRARQSELNMFGGGNKSKGEFGEVEVQWGKEKFRVDLPPPNSPLSALKHSLFNITGVPPDHQKLICSGAVLRDDLAPLSSFSLVDPCSSLDPSSSSSKSTSSWDSWSFKSKKSSAPVKKLLMMGTKSVSARVDDRLATRSDLKSLAQEQAEQAPVEKPKDDEETVVGKIELLVKGALEEWAPKIVGLEAYLAQKLGTPAPKAEAVEGEEEKEVDTEADPEEEVLVEEVPNPRTAAWLSEVLLQSLLKLDSIEIPSTYTQARKERKDAVRKLQGCLDRVDAYTSANAKL